MDIFIKKDGWHLVATDQDSLEHIKKLKKDKNYKIKITESRNYKFLQKYMVMITLGHMNTQLVDAQGVEIPKDSYRKLMQIRAGYFRAYKTNKGEYIEADSISFDSMDEETFERLYTEVKWQVANDLGVTSEDLELQVMLEF